MSEWNDETAEWYAKNYGDYPTNRLAVDQVELHDECLIVDIGCGTGSALRHASLKIKNGILIGVDPIPRMIEIAVSMTKDHPGMDQISFKVGSAEDIPIEDDLADYVFAFDSIDHWQDVDTGLNGVKRIIKPEGLFIIVKDKSVPSSKKSLKQLREKLDSSGFIFKKQKEVKTEDIEFSLWILNL
jgi:ubiquinone/menaquinone biosynthesis C-methylase UbiE